MVAATVSANVDERIANLIEERAKSEGRSKSGVIEDAILRYLEEPFEPGLTVKLNPNERAAVIRLAENQGLATDSWLHNAALAAIAAESRQESNSAGPSESTIRGKFEEYGRRKLTDRENVAWLSSRFNITVPQARKLLERVKKDGSQ